MSVPWMWVLATALFMYFLFPRVLGLVFGLMGRGE